MRSTFLPIFLLPVLFSAACGDKEADDTSSAEADADTDSDTDSDTDVDVSAEDASCGESATEALVLLSPSAGVIDVKHEAFDQGCCPDGLTVDLVVAAEERHMDITYTLGQDDCDCVCFLDATYVLSDLSPGTWEISAGSQTEQVEVD